MNKYIVNFVGVSTRVELLFERSNDFFENDDLSLVKKLLEVLKFKNQNSGNLMTADYHLEHISSIVKIVTDGDDYNETDIKNIDELEGIVENLIIDLAEFWRKDGDFDRHSKKPKRKDPFYKERLEHLSGNLRSH